MSQEPPHKLGCFLAKNILFFNNIIRPCNLLKLLKGGAFAANFTKFALSNNNTIFHCLQGVNDFVRG